MTGFTQFLTNHIWCDYLLRLTASLLCGFCLGFERKLRQHTVGLRTLILISVSSALLSILSSYMAQCGIISGDPTRISAAVITGIGFLGAGAIVNQGLNIRGLTSAAVIFAAAALGVTCGAGLYLPAFVVLAIVFITMFIIGKIEHKLFPAEKRKLLTLKFACKNIEQKPIEDTLKQNGIIIHDQDIIFNTETNKLTVIYTIKVPDLLDSIKLSDSLSQIPNLIEISLSKY